MLYLIVFRSIYQQCSSLSDNNLILPVEVIAEQNSSVTDLSLLKDRQVLMSMKHLKIQLHRTAKNNSAGLTLIPLVSLSTDKTYSISCPILFTLFTYQLQSEHQYKQKNKDRNSLVSSGKLKKLNLSKTVNSVHY